MAFSTHTYDEHRSAQRLIREQKNKEKRDKVNAEMQRLDDIRQQHAEMAQERQTRRLSELSPKRTSIAGYTSFDVKGGSSFGTAQRDASPKTPVVAQVRRRTVTLHELEKVQSLTGDSMSSHSDKKKNIDTHRSAARRQNIPVEVQPFKETL